MPDLHRRLPRRRDHRSGHASRRQPRHLHRLRRLHFRMPAGRDLQRRGRRRKMDQVQRRRIREGLIPFQTRKNKTPVRHIGGGFSYSQTFVIFRVSDMTLSFHRTTSPIASFCCAVEKEPLKNVVFYRALNDQAAEAVGLSVIDALRRIKSRRCCCPLFIAKGLSICRG